VDSKNTRATYFLAVALIALTVLVFAPVRTFQFVSFDDPLYVTENREVQSGLSWQGVKWAATSGEATNWHPITWLSHMLDVELFGMSPGAHHITSAAIHTLNVLLLFLLLVRMTGESAKSAFVAALFAIHPQHVESVAWVAERKDVLSTMFGFLAIHAYVSFVRKPGAVRYGFIMLVYALSLMSKPMLVTLPFMLLLLDIWPLRRLSREGSGRFAERLWICVREKLPLVAMAVLLSVVTLVVQSRGGTVGSLEVFPLRLRLANIPVSYLAYIYRTFWPTSLAPFYPLTPPPGFLVAAGLAVILAVSLMVLRLARQHRYLLVGWLWYLGTLAPVIGLIQAGDQANADRYTYVPLLGVFFMLTWGVWELLAASRMRTPLLSGVAIAAVGILSFMARSQVELWKDSLTLWSHASTVTKNNYLALTNLGFALNEAGRSDDALSRFTEAVRARPEFAESRNALGVALMSRGRLDEAAIQIREAIRIKPESGMPRNNLGMLLASQGRHGEATVQFMEGLRADPDNSTMRANLGMALAAQGRFDEAIVEYRKALTLEPDDADFHSKLGAALYNLGRKDEALAEFSRAVRLQPTLSDARNNLGVVLNDKGRHDEAIPQLREAIRLAPKFAQAHNNLGIALAARNQYDEAIASFQTALGLWPEYLEAKQNLELALASRGTQKR
jgi:tetratricopeptide (TPR) repeat protein